MQINQIEWQRLAAVEKQLRAITDAYRAYDTDEAGSKEEIELFLALDALTGGYEIVDNDIEVGPGLAEALSQADGINTLTKACICAKFKDTDGYQIADLACPIHGVDGTDPGDRP